MSFVPSCCAAALGIALCAGHAQAVSQTFTYDILNHPDGTQSPPPYALRLDNTVQSGVNVFIAENTDLTPDDPNDQDSDFPIGLTMTIVTDGVNTTLNIAGTVLGVFDLELYDVDFTYATGVEILSADEVEVRGFTNNSGTLTRQSDKMEWDLTPKAKGGDLVLEMSRSSERLFDSNGTLLPGLQEGDFSIEGWLMADPNLGTNGAQDWLFIARNTGGGELPTPGAFALVGAAGLIGLRRSR